MVLALGRLGDNRALFDTRLQGHRGGDRFAAENLVTRFRLGRRRADPRVFDQLGLAGEAEAFAHGLETKLYGVLNGRWRNGAAKDLHPATAAAPAPTAGCHDLDPGALGGIEDGGPAGRGDDLVSPHLAVDPQLNRVGHPVAASVRLSPKPRA